MIKAIFFDLDGTLLPLNEEKFIEMYFGLLANKVSHLGYNKEDLYKVIWTGTKAMFENDGSVTNEEAFWKVFVSFYGKEKLKDKSYFDDFYINEFKRTIEVCENNSLAREIVGFCNKNVEHTILSTNPIFPLNGTLTRMSFVDLKKEDFDFITAYENFSYSKPNPKYFNELLKMFNLKGEEVILFGNNTLEDGECSLACGIKCYLVDGYIINNPKATHKFPIIKMEDVIPTIKKEIEENKNA